MSEQGQEEDFAAMFEASIKTTRLQTGRAVEGRIVAIGAEVAFVDVGSKGEAVISLDELRNEDGAVEAKVGDRIQATVTSMGADGVQLSRKLQRSAASARQVEDAFHSRLPVEGKVEKEIKGGYEIAIAKLRAFCPHSQIDIVRHTDTSVHIGRVYAFRITEFAENGRKFVVSRRAVLEEEQKARAVEVRKTIAPGAVVTGRVVSVRDFGAFIDLGGIQGLLHVSEIGWSRVEAASALTPGQDLTLKVLRVDDASGQIALSLKQMLADPWEAVAANYAVGQVRKGRVTRIAEFGAFVELEPGIEALAHASTFAPTGRAGGWAKSIQIGTTAAFEILTIEPEKKRIGVAIVDAGSSREASAVPSRTAIAAGAKLTGKVERHEKFGIFVFLAPGVNGLIPNSETGVGQEQDLRKAFPVGSNVDVIVLEADAGGRRIRLSIKEIAAAEEAAEVREYGARKDEQVSASFGSLADKLRGALGRKTD